MVTLTTSTGVRIGNPTANTFAALLESLPRGALAILHCAHDNEFWQVWYRPNGIYQREYRAGTPSEHYQTLTVSRGKVTTAFLGWLKGDGQWKAAFTWTNIGHWFKDDED
ncbi:hypothetical protein [Amycolatopsis sp. FDAARGOS 1241]|uniref:hypothetical protein n=1 Tax=Amycolatopsis sp. FDAARGOS 1241 TaxID=2778070 RepID=UPI001951636C|nr:hypothetical protein [Amycolatopsis sp. FDAARGOS 1241]QRP44688.1 hypothetical protein I6J71_36465 [Amycolatopsis sp. FDAARGOS 1241]